MTRPAEGRTVAAFDFDGTLTTADTLRPFLREGLGTVGFVRSLAGASPTLAAYALGRCDNHVAKERLLTCALGGRAVGEVAEWGSRFLTNRLPKMLRPEMLARLEAHRRAGDLLVLVSASPDCYLQPWTQSLGFDALLCTQLEIADGCYTGRLATRNCWGEEKLRRLETWWGDAPPARLVAYGDSKGDAAMLARADEAWWRGQRVEGRFGLR